MMKLTSSVLILLALFAVQCSSREPQYLAFYYFVQQWPGSVCGTKEGCCYPITGKPASSFMIHSIWPYTFGGTELVDCDLRHHLRPSKQISAKLTSQLQRHWPSLACPSSDSSKLWSSEWAKHGTCSRRAPNQFFKAAVQLHKQVNLLKILNNAGIHPNGSFYNLGDVYEAITNTTIYSPGIQCSLDKAGNSQIDLVYLCTGSLAYPKVTDCLGMLPSNCEEKVRFPSF